jgi:hypothetical protein
MERTIPRNVLQHKLVETQIRNQTRKQGEPGGTLEVGHSTFRAGHILSLLYVFFAVIQCDQTATRFAFNLMRSERTSRLWKVNSSFALVEENDL